MFSFTLFTFKELLQHLCLNSHLCRIVSSLDKIASILGPGLAPGQTLRHLDDSFEMEVSLVDVSAVTRSGYAIEFVQNEEDKAVLPGSLFSSHEGNALLSSSLISQTAVFRGRDKTVFFASKIFSISVIGEGTILDDPVTVTFRKTATVSFKRYIIIITIIEI